MNTTLTLIDLAGSIALLLWGVHMVQTGIQRAYGPDLRRVLGAGLSNRVKAFAAGLGVTAILQSSTATGLMAASFAAGGFVELMPALAIMLGANVGTTLIVQVLSFEVSRAAPALILVGVIAFRRANLSRTRDIGRVAIGLGLMLLSLSRLLEMITPHEDAPSLRLLMGIVTSDPFVAALVAAVLTWAAHSSVAIVLLVMSFADKGIVPVGVAMALVVGANLGSALNPLLEGAGGDAAARRVAVGNLANRLVGCALTLPFIAYLGPILVRLQPDPSRAVADFHLGFNLVLAALFLPLLGPVSRLLRRWLPTRIDVADPSRPLHLDTAALETPPIALGHAAREALRMVDVLEEMLRAAGEAVRGQRESIPETRRLENVLDSLNRSIKSYVASVEPDAMGAADERRASAILVFTTNLEHAGDILDRSVVGNASRRLKRGLVLSEREGAEAAEMLGRLRANLRAAGSVFVTEDVRAARLLADEKAVFRDLESRGIEISFSRLRSRRDAAGPETSAIHLDLMRDLKRVNDHLVAAAAYPVLAGQGELLASRIRTE